MTDTNHIAQKSRKYFSSGLCCAESVLLAIAESQGIESEWIPRIATGFCSGLARTSGLCGAVTGGVMAINLVTGRVKPGAPADKNYAAVQEFLRQFEGQFSSTNCALLLGCDLGTPEGQQYFKDHQLIKQCQRYVGEATQMVADVLAAAGENPNGAL